MLDEGEGEGLSDFSLYPWLGTAGHAYLETTVFQDDTKFLHEQRLYVGDVPGYGPIKGTADLIAIGDAVIDWKFVGIKKINAYRAAKQSPTGYRYQRQLYARGCELAGYPVVRVANVYIPRDSGNVSDIWVDEEAYQPDMAERALARAGDVYAEALVNGADALPSDDHCYVCNNLMWR
jgi:hypothetical protein